MMVSEQTQRQFLASESEIHTLVKHLNSDTSNSSPVNSIGIGIPGFEHCRSSTYTVCILCILAPLFLYALFERCDML